MNEWTITLDGQELRATPGETILAVAKRAGIHIPTLCHHPRLRDVGSCRVCVVEVEGVRSLTAACTGVIERDGMVVRTNTERVLQARRLVVELLVASGDHDCPNCPSNGRCELQDLVEELEIDHPRFPAESPGHAVEAANPMIRRDLNKCVLCGRCVRACNEIQVNRVINFGFRGSESKIVTGGDLDYWDSNCVFCGECVQVCPVGALSEIQRTPHGKSWEEKTVRSVCTYCGVGCNIQFHLIDGKIARVTGVEGVKPNNGSLCVKGRFGNDFIDHPDRLKTPLIKEKGVFREASWDEALTLAARRFRAIKEEHGSDALASIASGRCTNESNYIMGKFTRAVFGNNNVDHCARV